MNVKIVEKNQAEEIDWTSDIVFNPKSGLKVQCCDVSPAGDNYFSGVVMDNPSSEKYVKRGVLTNSLMKSKFRKVVTEGVKQREIDWNNDYVISNLTKAIWKCNGLSKIPGMVNATIFASPDKFDVGGQGCIRIANLRLFNGTITIEI